jgi:steroid delta-isomerase-like uncharacterized protein
MSHDDAKTLVQEYIEAVWNRGDMAALAALTTPGFLYHLGGQPGRDRSGMQQFLDTTLTAFPDWKVEVGQIIAEGNLVAVHWHGRVTHQGAFHTLPPTGRSIAVSGINFYRIEGGKVAEEWEQTDSLGMLRQLGASPG